MSLFSRAGPHGLAPPPNGLVEGDYTLGSVVPWHFSPGIIVASFFASLIGTLLTVEVLHRKRLGKSWISRYA